MLVGYRFWYLLLATAALALGLAAIIGPAYTGSYGYSCSINNGPFQDFPAINYQATFGSSIWNLAPNASFTNGTFPTGTQSTGFWMTWSDNGGNNQWVDVPTSAGVLPAGLDVLGLAQYYSGIGPIISLSVALLFAALAFLSGLSMMCRISHKRYDPSCCACHSFNHPCTAVGLSATAWVLTLSPIITFPSRLSASKFATSWGSLMLGLSDSCNLSFNFKYTSALPLMIASMIVGLIGMIVAIVLRNKAHSKVKHEHSHHHSSAQGAVVVPVQMVGQAPMTYVDPATGQAYAAGYVDPATGQAYAAGYVDPATGQAYAAAPQQGYAKGVEY